MREFNSFCDFHIGDNLMFLHYLRKVSSQPMFQDARFIHAVHECHIPQLEEAIEDMPNISLVPYEQRKPGSFNTWKQANNFWASHPLRNDYTAFYIDYFRRVAGAYYRIDFSGLSRDDLLLDYPALLKANPLTGAHYDVLLINSRPCSGQFMAYDDVNCMDGMIQHLKEAGRKIIVTQPSQVKDIPCTQDWKLTVTQIGNLSLSVDYIVGVSTGPSWGTFNTFNQDTVKKRIIMIERERLNLGKNLVCVSTFGGAYEEMKSVGLL